MERLARVLSSVAAVAALVLITAVSLVLLFWLVMVGLAVGAAMVIVRGVRKLARPCASGWRGDWEGRRNVRVVGVVGVGRAARTHDSGHGA